MLVRRVRAGLVLAAVWSLLWAPLGVVLFLGMLSNAVELPLTWHDLRHIVMRGALIGGVWGLVSGIVFTAALAAAERGGAVESLARRRILLWGAASGAALPLIIVAVTLSIEGGGGLLFVPILTVIGVGALFGALVAAALLSLARRASVTA